MINFAGLRYFKPTSADAWGDPSKMNRELLLELDSFRGKVGQPMYVTSGYRPGDFSSEHSRGNAVDIVCPGVDLFELYLLAERFNFSGIGVYPEWMYMGQPVGGLHLDVRKAEHGARWLGVKGSNNKNQYLALSKENLKKFGVI